MQTFLFIIKLVEIPPPSNVTPPPHPPQCFSRLHPPSQSLAWQMASECRLYVSHNHDLIYIDCAHLDSACIFNPPRSKSFKSSQSRSLNQTKWVPLAPCQIMSHMYQIFQYRLKLYLKIFSVPNVSAHSHNPIFLDRAHFPCALLSSH